MTPPAVIVSQEGSIFSVKQSLPDSQTIVYEYGPGILLYVMAIASRHIEKWFGNIMCYFSLRYRTTVIPE